MPAQLVSAAIGGAVAVALDLVTFRVQRKFSGPLDLDVMCAVSEEATDELEITEHPVEQGASITDHAFVKPARVVLEWAWSNSPQSIFDINIGGLFQGGGVIDVVYEQLRALKDSRQPFTLVTGKRTYENMLMKLISVPTKVATENSLVCTIHCQQILIVETEETTVASNPDDLADPADTQGVQDTGDKNLLPVTDPPADVVAPIDFDSAPFVVGP